MWGFLGAWFFLILAPTSSFMPIRDLAFEHRMYLPLAAVIALAVAAAHLASERMAARLFASEARRRRVRIAVAIALMLPLTGALLWRTYVRNLDYRDPISIWTATTKVSALNSRAWSNLGLMCFYAGRYDEAKKDCAEATRLNPGNADAFNNLGLAYAAMNQLAEALRDYDEAVRLDPNHVEAHINRGNAYDALGRSQDALREYARAAAVKPDDDRIYDNRAITYYRTKEYAKARADIEKLRDLGRGRARAASRGHHGRRGALVAGAGPAENEPLPAALAPVLRAGARLSQGAAAVREAGGAAPMFCIRRGAKRWTGASPWSGWATWGCRWRWLSGRRRRSSASTSAAGGSRNCARREDHTHEVSPADLAESHVEYTTDPAALKRADFIIVTVPTPVDDAKQPDLSCLVSASETVGPQLRAAARSSSSSPPSIRA